MLSVPFYHETVKKKASTRSASVQQTAIKCPKQELLSKCDVIVRLPPVPKITFFTVYSNPFLCLKKSQMI